MMKKTIKLFVIVASLFFVQELCSQTKAFPTAEGYGQFTVGGRGGKVYHVTNLNNSGPGSLRFAVESKGARTIVFAISGTIYLNSNLTIKNDSITIAGQTAPGDGICIAGYPFKVDTNEVIIRYLRFRMGDENKQEADAIWGREMKNIIIDHCSMSWSIDEAASFYDNENFTLQWCIISESLYNSFHSKGAHGYGGIWGGMGATFHHNLLAHHNSRNPRFNGSRYHGKPELEIVDFVNNVIYNWGDNSAYGGEAGNHNIRANYFKYGPATSSSKRNRILEAYDVESNWYIADNFVYGYPEITDDNWNGGVQGYYSDSLKNKNITTPFPISPVTTQTSEQAFELVLNHAGASFPKRDEIDLRIVEETRSGTATFGSTYSGGGKGIIDSQDDVGGWPNLNSLPSPVDTDLDGMPDYWEIENGLDHENPDDRNNLNADGYTMLEVYLNSLVDNITSMDDEKEVKIYDFNLSQNYPNPFNPTTKIKFTIPNVGDEYIRPLQTKLIVYDILGREIITLINREFSPGNYEVVFDGSNLSSGIYFYSLISDKKIISKKMMLCK